jgi:hypothetical protein
VSGPIGFDADGDTAYPVVSIFESTGSDPAAPWRWAGVIDYSTKLPY